VVGPGRPASAVRDALARVAAHSPGARIPGVQLLGERAALTGLGRRGPRSCGGAFRLLRTADGWCGLSLARRADVELLPALLEQPDVKDPWTEVALWARRTTTDEVDQRLLLLGLPGGAVPRTPPDDRAGVTSVALGTRTPVQTPLVLDLTSLWAGPLCAHLLGLSGARVVKVESTHRPDGARHGPPAFFNLLHDGHEQLTLDLPRDLNRLRELVDTADLVLEASRPRALRQWGISAEQVVRTGTSWLSITARGRQSDAIGFGDDVAAAAGHVVHDGADLMPVGDALADPLAGVSAAAAALDVLRSSVASLVDVSMLHVAAEAAAGPVPPHLVTRRAAAWWVEDDSGQVPVADPVARR
jgi:hypothetical protein